MMYVKTKLGMSKIHGIGLFADEFISKGTIVWKFVPGLDMRFTREQIDSLSPVARQYIATYTYLSKESNLLVFPIDNAKHFNHSENPNCISDQYDDNEAMTIALRDIQVGEEMSEDYRILEKDAENRESFLRK